MPLASSNGETYRQFPQGTLILNDCIDAMRCMPSRSVDFILTDPPYLVNYQSRDGRSIASDVDNDWLLPAFTEAFRLLKPDSFAVSFYGWSKCDRFMAAWRKAGFHIVGHLTFIKRYSSKTSYLQYQHESAFLMAKDNPAQPENPISDVLEFKYTGNKLHPTQKPVGPLRQLISCFSQPGDIVLDPFAGSGSTAIAAFLENREFIAVEKMPKYFDIASNRLHEAVNTPVKRPQLRAV